MYLNRFENLLFNFDATTDYLSQFFIPSLNLNFCTNERWNQHNNHETLKNFNLIFTGQYHPKDHFKSFANVYKISKRRDRAQTFYSLMDEKTQNLDYFFAHNGNVL